MFPPIKNLNPQLLGAAISVLLLVIGLIAGLVTGEPSRPEQPITAAPSAETSVTVTETSTEPRTSTAPTSTAPTVEPTPEPETYLEAHQRLVDELRSRTPQRQVENVGIALAIDHGTNALQSDILAMLRERNLPFTLALNATMYDPQSRLNPPENQTSWGTIQSWVDQGDVTIANHGASHNHIPNDEVALRSEIEGGKSGLMDNLPSVPVDTWVQSAGKLGDFATGINPDHYDDTIGGQTLLRNHALIVSGAAKQWPLTGQPFIGMNRTWLDNPSGIDSTKAQISNTPDGYGRIVSFHPERIGGEGRTSFDELEEALDWLVEQQESGDITILPLAELAFANS